MPTDQGGKFVDVPDDVPEPHWTLDLERDPTGDPTHPHWQGHTHRWPKRATRGFLTCKECGAVETPESIKGDDRG